MIKIGTFFGLQNKGYERKEMENWSVVCGGGMGVMDEITRSTQGFVMTIGWMKSGR